MGSLLVASAATWLVFGEPAATGLAIGGGIALFLLMVGAGSVAVAASSNPQASLAVAITTFMLVVVLAAAGFRLLEVSGAVGTAFPASWLAGGVAFVGAVWSVAHLVGHARSRIPAFDLTAVPGPAGGEQRSSSRGAEAVAEGAHEATRARAL